MNKELEKPRAEAEAAQVGTKLRAEAEAAQVGNKISALQRDMIAMKRLQTNILSELSYLSGRISHLSCRI